MADTSEQPDQPFHAPRIKTETQNRKCSSWDRSPKAATPVVRPADDRAGAVADTAGALTGTYEPRELGRLREDWPD